MIELVVPFSASGGSVVSVNGKMGVVVLTPEDIGALPEGALEGYATELYVQEQIENIDIPDTDLTGYATEDYVKAEIAKAQLEGEDVDLSAYATKQYVSEQVNAVELMPGPQGPAGPKGNDGYTPVKGVDYFDGQTGPEGPAGKDYVLTDEDKAEIAGLVEVAGGECLLNEGSGTDSIRTPTATQAGGNNSIVLGYKSSSSGHRNHILGANNTTGSGSDAFAIGSNNTTYYQNSGVIGNSLKCSKAYQIVLGRYNEEDSNALFIIGNGSGSGNRNAMTVDGSNQVHFPGTVVIGADKEEVATKAYVDANAGSGGGGGGNVDLSNYYTKEEIDAMLPPNVMEVYY